MLVMSNMFYDNRSVVVSEIVDVIVTIRSHSFGETNSRLHIANGVSDLVVVGVGSELGTNPK